MRLVTVDVDSADGLELLWAELKHHREIRNADPQLRAAIIRRCKRLPASAARPVLDALDEMHPGVVLESFFTTVVPDRKTIGWRRRYNAEKASFENGMVSNDA